MIDGHFNFHTFVVGAFQIVGVKITPALRLGLFEVHTSWTLVQRDNLKCALCRTNFGSVVQRIE